MSSQVEKNEANFNFFQAPKLMDSNLILSSVASLISAEIAWMPSS